ncbi:MAG TPA: exopolysaccharide biosynthesis protein [Parvularculaceae bacterium]|nr:exopolysaccharide biosynthesis protein [Parvularculaceae bacterium]HNS87889.1 exopolysaccharide biosynthesis protein [Parvularculaceae bacterium]
MTSVDVDRRAMNDKEAEEFQHEKDARRGATQLLIDILDDLEARQSVEPGGKAEASLRDFIERLDERAFGLALLLFALPSSVPFVYVLPQILSVPMLALAGQMAAGRESPWLPSGMQDRRFEIAPLRGVIKRCEPYTRWFEALARPRMTALTGRVGARAIGALLLIPAISILVPLPGTNAVPAMGISLTSLGLIERDGVLVILGLLVGLGWVALLLVFGLSAATILKDFLLTLF